MRTRAPKPGCSLADLFPEIAEEWHPTKNGRLGPGDVRPSSGVKVWWQCRKDATHEWSAWLEARTGQRRPGCPLCANHCPTPTNSLAARFPAVAAEWHPTRNGQLRPDRVVAGARRVVWWQCRNNPAHVWRAIVGARALRGAGCPACGNRVATKDNCLLARRPDLARQWHPTRNGPLTPADVVPGSNKKVWWRCERNPAHEWEAVVRNRSRGSGCYHCFCDERRQRFRHSTEQAAPDPALQPARGKQDEQRKRRS
jgi:hypothetical protein